MMNYYGSWIINLCHTDLMKAYEHLKIRFHINKVRVLEGFLLFLHEDRSAPSNLRPC